MSECASFLRSIGQLFEAFSNHNKEANYTLKSVEEALCLVRQCKDVLDKNIEGIRTSTGIGTTINGPQGYTFLPRLLYQWD